MLVHLVFLVVSASSCSLLKSTQKETLEELKTKQVDSAVDCIEPAIEKGWYQLGVALAEIAVDKEEQLPTGLREKLRTSKRNLDKLVQILDSHGKVSLVSPAFQWAQSPSFVFLDVKFSHRLDSPGCLELKDMQVSISDKKLEFSGLCSRSNQRIKINLNMDLYSDIDPEESNYSVTSVGRINFNLKKKELAAWPKPMKGKKFSNMHTWWEIREKYSEEMKEYSDDYEEYTPPDPSSIDDLINKIPIQNSAKELEL